MPLIETRDLWKTYVMGAEEIHALRGISIQIERGEYVAIMGPSGSGKSTLMNLLGCLDTPTSGQYELNGVNVSEMNDNQLAEIHWYGESLAAPLWQDPDARVLCFTLAGVAPQEPALHVMINMAPTVRNLPLPDPAARNWRRIVDTTFDAPNDIVPAGLAVRGTHYALEPHGIAVFEDSAFVVQSGA